MTTRQPRHTGRRACYVAVASFSATSLEFRRWRIGSACLARTCRMLRSGAERSRGFVDLRHARNQTLSLRLCSMIHAARRTDHKTTEEIARQRPAGGSVPRPLASAIRDRRRKERQAWERAVARRIEMHAHAASSRRVATTQPPVDRCADLNIANFETAVLSMRE